VPSEQRESEAVPVTLPEWQEFLRSSSAETRNAFERLRREESRPVQSRPVMDDELLAEGRRHAAAGDADAAQASFHAAHACGSALAPYLAGLLMCFTAPGPPAESFIRGNVIHDHILRAVDEVCLRAELIPLYLNAWRDGAGMHPGYLARPFGGYLPAADPATEPDTMHEDEILAARAARYVAPVLPEAPAFQQALDRARALIARGDNDAAWTVIQRALPLWEPCSGFRIAPVILRVDPAFRPVITRDRYRTIVGAPHGQARCSFGHPGGWSE
jgi:hypothetical protein